LRGLHRYAVFLAIFGLAVIISGAFITSAQVAAKQAQAEVAGAGDELHRGLSIALTLLTLAAAVWSSVGKQRAQAQLWSGSAALAVSAALGWRGTPLSPGIAVLHALLAHLFLAIVVVAAVTTSRKWNQPAEVSSVTDWSWLRPLALATPPVVFVQILLGTAYRHDLTGVFPHMAGAMVAAIMTVVLAAVVLQNFPGPKPLLRSATVLISIVLTQICLGIVALVMLVLNAAGTLAFVFGTVGHVTVGAATLAASAEMAMQVWRLVPPKPAT
jgi:heme A synthase